METTDSRYRRSSSRLLSAGLLALVAGTALAALGRVDPRPLQEPQAPPPPTTIIIGGGVQRFGIPECVPRSGDQASREACRTIAQVLRNDLRFEIDGSQFVPDNLMAAIPAMNPDAPNFKDWESIGAGILIVTRAEAKGGELAVELAVHFVRSGQRMLSKRYSGPADNPRLFAHQAADDVLSLTQIRGISRTKIAFVSDRDSTKDNRGKEIYVMDYDAFNPRRITVRGSLNILPAWRPDGRGLAYTSYRQGSPTVFLAPFGAQAQVNITGERGSQAFAPAWSPDGKRLAFASNRSGNMEVWVVNADGTGARNLSQNAAADTAPCWSPTGQEIAFTSSRTGTPQIFLMEAETGLNVRRVTGIGNYNDAPSWNPSKEWSEIAFTSRIEGGFEVAVIDLASRQVRQITEGRGSCEYPTWAPNGRHLVFSCERGGAWQITVSDRLGRTVQTLAAGPGNNAQPDWGP